MQDGNSFLLQIRLNFIVDRTSGTDKKPQFLSRWKGVPPEVPLREFPYGCRCGLVCKGRGYCIEEQRQPERRQSTEPYTAGTAEKIVIDIPFKKKCCSIKIYC